MMWTRQVKKALVVYDVWLKHALTMGKEYKILYLSVRLLKHSSVH